MVKHSDRHNVVTLFTRSRGRVALLTPASGSGKQARMRAARLQLLSVVEADINFRAGRDLSTLGSFAPARLWRGLYLSPEKCSLVFFLAEFLNRFLKAAAPEEAIWDYTVESLERLDAMERGVGNFHISFLTGLLALSGVMPDWRGWRPRMWFDLRSGEFTPSIPTHPDRLAPAEARAAALMLRLGSRGMASLRASRESRRRILEVLLAYYGLHFPGASDLTSPEILRQLQ